MSLAAISNTVRRQLRVVLGRVPFSGRPTAEQNRLVDLYSADGLSITLQTAGDLLRIVEEPSYVVLFQAIMSNPNAKVQFHFPCQVLLNIPWSVACRTNEQLPTSFQAAFLEQIASGYWIERCTFPFSQQFGTGTLFPAGAPVMMCAFSHFFNRASPAFREPYVVERRAEGRKALVPIFRQPKLLGALLKSSESHNNTGEVEQQWVPFMYCTNCRAENAVDVCSWWAYSCNQLDSYTMKTPVGSLSDWDIQWSGAIRDNVSERYLNASIKLNMPIPHDSTIPDPHLRMLEVRLGLPGQRPVPSYRIQQGATTVSSGPDL